MTLPTFAAGQRVPGADLQDVVDEVNALRVDVDGNRLGRRVGIAVQTADVTANSSTAVFHSSLKFTAACVAGEVIEAQFSGALRGDTAGNYATVQIWGKAGTSVDATGTQLTGAKKVMHSADSANRLNDCNVIGQLAITTTGNHAFGVSIALAGGGGTVTLDYANGNQSPLIGKVVVVA
jgi:hypothetical protein